MKGKKQKNKKKSKSKEKKVTFFIDDDKKENNVENIYSITKDELNNVNEELEKIEEDNDSFAKNNYIPNSDTDDDENSSEDMNVNFYDTKNLDDALSKKGKYVNPDFNEFVGLSGKLNNKSNPFIKESNKFENKLSKKDNKCSDNNELISYERNDKSDKIKYIPKAEKALETEDTICIEKKDKNTLKQRNIINNSF